MERKHTKLLFILLTGSIFCGDIAFGQDRLAVAKSETIKGFIGQRLDNSYTNGILRQDAPYLVAPFRNRNETRLWQSEFWGKWFTSAVLAYRYKPTPELKQKLDATVKDLISTQTPDGYIGNYAKESRLQQWDIWGRKYCMLGLLDYHALTGDKKSLQAARAVADNLMADLKSGDGLIVTKGNYRGMAASSVLEPICHLYTYTKDKKYLEFAEEIVRQWETPNGPQLISKADVDVSKRYPVPVNWYSYEQGQKAYEMMSCYEGLLELYRLTGKAQYKSAVEKTWQNILDTEINVAGSGASTEMWFGGRLLQTAPVNHFQETCVTVTWIKLSQQLLRLTGESKYADAVEQSYYNALLGSMSPDGVHWAKYTPLSGHRMPGSGQCGMNLNCCEASGPRGLFNLPQHVAMKSADGLYVNYFIEGNYLLTTPSGRKLELVQETNYPESGKIDLSVKVTKPEDFVINVRIPAWSKVNVVMVNGGEVKSVKSGEYVAIKRNWKNTDRISVELDMRGRVEYLGERPQYAAIMRGPIVLSRDASLPGVSIGAIVNPGAKGGYVKLIPSVQRDSKNWLQYSLTFTPESYKEAGDKPVTIDLCDYASAGNNAQATLYTTWLPQLIDPKKLK